MVEKVDRSQTSPAYHILPTKETKDDKSRKQEYEEGEERYQKGAAKGDWSKYRSRAMTIKPVRAPRDRIGRVLFRNTALKGGTGILEATVVWKDGRTTEPVLFLIPRTDEYMKLRLLKRGQVVPENFWAKGDQIEMGIVQLEPGSGSWGTKELEREEKAAKAAEARSSWLATTGLVNKATGRFQWFVLAMYLLGIMALALAIVFAVR